jgi:hypothetical protein
LQGNLQPAQNRIQLHTGGPEGLYRSQAHAQTGGFFRGDLQHIDLGPQRFAQRGLHRHPAQRQRERITGLQQPGAQQCGRRYGV